VLARRGEAEEAERLAREAVAISTPRSISTSAPLLWQARARGWQLALLWSSLQGRMHTAPFVERHALVVIIAIGESLVAHRVRRKKPIGS
jgi:hypothetical protein